MSKTNLSDSELSNSDGSGESESEDDSSSRSDSDDADKSKKKKKINRFDFLGGALLLQKFVGCLNPQVTNLRDCPGFLNTSIPNEYHDLRAQHKLAPLPQPYPFPSPSPPPPAPLHQEKSTSLDTVIIADLQQIAKEAIVDTGLITMDLPEKPEKMSLPQPSPPQPQQPSQSPLLSPSQPPLLAQPLPEPPKTQQPATPLPAPAPTPPPPAEIKITSLPRPPPQPEVKTAQPVSSSSASTSSTSTMGLQLLPPPPSVESASSLFSEMPKFDFDFTAFAAPTTAIESTSPTKATPVTTTVEPSKEENQVVVVSSQSNSSSRVKQSRKQKKKERIEKKKDDVAAAPLVKTVEKEAEEKEDHRLVFWRLVLVEARPEISNLQLKNELQLHSNLIQFNQDARHQSQLGTTFCSNHPEMRFPGKSVSEMYCHLLKLQSHDASFYQKYESVLPIQARFLEKAHRFQQKAFLEHFLDRPASYQQKKICAIQDFDMVQHLRQVFGIVSSLPPAMIVRFEEEKKSVAFEEARKKQESEFFQHRQSQIEQMLSQLEHDRMQRHMEHSILENQRKESVQMFEDYKLKTIQQLSQQVGTVKMQLMEDVSQSVQSLREQLELMQSTMRAAYQQQSSPPPPPAAPTLSTEETQAVWKFLEAETQDPPPPPPPPAFFADVQPTATTSCESTKKIDDLSAPVLPVAPKELPLPQIKSKIATDDTTSPVSQKTNVLEKNQLNRKKKNTLQPPPSQSFKGPTTWSTKKKKQHNKMATVAAEEQKKKPHKKGRNEDDTAIYVDEHGYQRAIDHVVPPAPSHSVSSPPPPLPPRPAKVMPAVRPISPTSSTSSSVSDRPRRGRFPFPIRPPITRQPRKKMNLASYVSSSPRFVTAADIQWMCDAMQHSESEQDSVDPQRSTVDIRVLDSPLLGSPLNAAPPPPAALNAAPPPAALDSPPALAPRSNKDNDDPRAPQSNKDGYNATKIEALERKMDQLMQILLKKQEPPAAAPPPPVHPPPPPPPQNAAPLPPPSQRALHPHAQVQQIWMANDNDNFYMENYGREIKQTIQQERLKDALGPNYFDPSKDWDKFVLAERQEMLRQRNLMMAERQRADTNFEHFVQDSQNWLDTGSEMVGIVSKLFDIDKRTGVDIGDLCGSMSSVLKDPFAKEAARGWYYSQPVPYQYSPKENLARVVLNKFLGWMKKEAAAKGLGLASDVVVQRMQEKEQEQEREMRDRDSLEKGNPEEKHAPPPPAKKYAPPPYNANREWSRHLSVFAKIDEEREKLAQKHHEEQKRKEKSEKDAQAALASDKSAHEAAKSAHEAAKSAQDAKMAKFEADVAQFEKAKAEFLREQANWNEAKSTAAAMALFSSPLVSSTRDEKKEMPPRASMTVSSSSSSTTTTHVTTTTMIPPPPSSSSLTLMNGQSTHHPSSDKGKATTKKYDDSDDDEDNERDVNNHHPVDESGSALEGAQSKSSEHEDLEENDDGDDQECNLEELSGLEGFTPGKAPTRRFIAPDGSVVTSPLPPKKPKKKKSSVARSMLKNMSKMSRRIQNNLAQTERHVENVQKQAEESAKLLQQDVIRRWKLQDKELHMDLTALSSPHPTPPPPHHPHSPPPTTTTTTPPHPEAFVSISIPD
jgi:hypothetical protein